MLYRLANLNRNIILTRSNRIDGTENILNQEWNGNQNPELVKYWQQKIRQNIYRKTKKKTHEKMQNIKVIG